MSVYDRKKQALGPYLHADMLNSNWHFYVWSIFLF